MKIRFMGVLLSGLMLASLLGGCSGKSGSDGGDGKKELSIYYLSSDAKVQSYLTAFSSEYTDVNVDARAFDEAEEMDKIVTNELNAGKGPDVIILGSGNSVDALRLAKSGALASLDGWIQEDSTLKTEDYLPGALEAGQVDGKQYLMPLTFKLPLIYHNEASESKDILMSYDEFAEAVNSNIERFKSDKNNGAIAYTSLMPPLMVSGDAITLSNDNRSVTYDEAKLEQLVTIMQTIYKETDKMSGIASSQGGDTLSVVGQFAMLLDYPVDFIHQAWMVENFYADNGMEGFQISAMSQGSNDEVYGVLSSYGVATKNADKSAYDFLRMAMDENSTSGRDAAYGTSLNKSAIEKQILTHKTMTGNMKTSRGSISMKGLSDEGSGDLGDIVNKITSIKVFNPQIMDIMYDNFEPFLNEEKAYADCLTEFKQKMNLYVTE